MGAGLNASLAGKARVSSRQDRGGVLLQSDGEPVASPRTRFPSVAAEIESADDIAASFRAASKRLERRPALARSLMDGRIGRHVRSESRRQRAVSIRRAVERAAPGSPSADLARMSAVLAYLCSANAWLTMGEESGLSGDDARTAVT